MNLSCPATYTGELFGMEYLFSQTGEPLAPCVMTRRKAMIMTDWSTRTLVTTFTFILATSLPLPILIKDSPPPPLTQLIFSSMPLTILWTWNWCWTRPWLQQRLDQITGPQLQQSNGSGSAPGLMQMRPSLNWQAAGGNWQSTIPCGDGSCRLSTIDDLWLSSSGQPFLPGWMVLQQYV
ncbi:hypothetical protein RRG08_040343 [Elysia crispata]|uniref:Uncharacterized protein n=1 Tax=Elysia crispata TaxID=231223 RepID=A0AAE1E595_9GAST|nr:hypothetical protein RRG08_040343 [Elysia crispata]